MTPTALRLRRTLPSLGLLLVLALTGCDSSGSTGSAGPTVASLPTSAAPSAGEQPAAAPPPASAPERPLLRNDASDAERARLAGIYIDCLVGAGLSAQMVVKGSDYAYPDREMLTQQQIATCGNKEPELPFQRAMRKDPTFADHVHDDVTCLNQHGIAAIVQKDGGVGLEDGLPSDDKSHWLQDCENQAFASFYSTLPAG